MNTESLIKIFNETAKAHHQSFPKKLKNLLITSTKGSVYISDKTRKNLDKHLNFIDQIINRCAKEMIDMRAGGYAGKYNDTNEKIYFNFIILNMGITNIIGTPIENSKEIEMIYALDHELGHLIVDQGVEKNLMAKEQSHLTECAADAYATLRHLQRFGEETGFLEAATNYRSEMIIFSSKTHYTSNIFQVVKQLSQETDIKTLSLKETAKLANKIAIKYQLNDETLNKIHDAFEPVRTIRQNAPNNGNAIITEIINTMIRHQDDTDIYRAGKLFLQREEEKHFTDHVIQSTFGWGNLFSDMEEHEKKTDFTINFTSPKVKKKPIRRKKQNTRKP